MQVLFIILNYVGAQRVSARIKEALAVNETKQSVENEQHHNRKKAVARMQKLHAYRYCIILCVAVSKPNRAA